MWYYIKNEQMLGPISLEELVNLINAGRITKTTYVWESGKIRQLAGQTEKLAEFFDDDEPEPSALPEFAPKPTFTKKSAPKKDNERVMDTVLESTGLKHLDGFSLSDLFSETFKRHTDDEMERYFGVGTPLTTPPISQVNASWPKPWLFLRLIILGVVGYWLMARMSLDNPNAFPGMIIFGSFVIPLATLTFFFECNVVKNISLYQVIKLFLYGGAVGFIFTTILDSLFPSLSDPDNLSASSAGLIEEPAKLLVLILVLIMGGLKRKDYILNGLLCGAAVGAGFAAFESAGYAFTVFFEKYNFMISELIQQRHSEIDPLEIMKGNIYRRGVLAPFGHVIWTAMCAGALWRVKKSKDFAISMLFNPMFLIVFAIAVTLHMTWNSEIFNDNFGDFGCYALGIIGWTIIFGMIGLGLRQVRQQQKYIATKEAQRKQAKPQ